MLRFAGLLHRGPVSFLKKFIFFRKTLDKFKSICYNKNVDTGNYIDWNIASL